MKNIIKLLLNIILIIALFINFYTKSFNNYLVLGLMLLNFIVVLFINGYRNQNKRNMGTVCLIVFLGAFLAISLFYFVGVYSEFNRNFMYIPYKFIKKSIWIPTVLTVILTELFRYVSLTNKTGNKIYRIIYVISLFILFVLIDVNISQKIVDFKSFNSVYEFFALTICASLIKNIFLMWTSTKYGYVPCLIYRFIIDLYIYFIPYVPKNNLLLQACLFMLLPFVLYTVIDGLNSEREIPKAKDLLKRRIERLETVVLLIIFGILAGLVSREFRYSMIAVGSESMTGTYNKGDAIVYERYNGEILHEGDVIVFRMEGRLIVHRIHKRLFFDNDYAFITKGDANDTEDNWIVENNMVVGRVVQGVKYIAWPSVWLNENF